MQTHKPTMICQRQGCARPAYKGRTHCARHYTAGDSLANARRKQTRHRRPTQSETEWQCINSLWVAALKYRNNWPQEHYERRRRAGWIRGPLELNDTIEHLYTLLCRRIIWDKEV